jgi:hypothetical protein
MSRSLPLIEPLESRYAPASLSIGDVSIDEGTGGTKIFSFKVTLDGDITSSISVGYITGDGTAKTSDNDYTAKSGFLTFSPPIGGAEQVREQNISIVVTGDNKFEVDETFRVNLVNASEGVTISDGEAIGTIENDDTAPKISIGSASISEGNIAIGSLGTPQRMTFTVSLSNASYLPVSVLVSTVDGTASSVNDSDFVAKSETITFDPGQTSKTFVVDLNGDIIGEVNETFTVQLSNELNGTLNDNQKVGTGTILNDDPTIRVTDVRVAEGNPATSGNPGTTDMVLTIVLDRAGKNDVVTVHYATADGTAIAGEDYVAQLGDLTFQPGETIKQVIVKVNKDSAPELDETVLLNLSDATNAHIDDPQVVGTIANDEITAGLKVNAGTQLNKKEGEFGTQVEFTITLSAEPTDPAGVDVALLFAGSATKGQDYVIVEDPNLQSIHFGPTETTKTFHVTINDDDLVSLDETLQVSLSGATNAVVDNASSQTTVTIQNDDGEAYLIIDDPAAAILEANDAKATLTVRLSKGVEGAVNFNYATVSDTAIAGSDFVSVSKVGTIDAGSLETQIQVSLLNDALNEKAETFKVQLSGGTGGATTVGGTADPTAVVTITDDDLMPKLSFESTEVLKIVEGDNGTKLATFKVKLDTPSGREVTVRAVTVNGTATAGQDYVAFDKVIKIAAGQTEATFTVELNGDTADEIDENFFIQLSEPDGATITAGNEQVETKILNNDRQIIIDDVLVSEGAGQASFSVRLNGPSLHPVTVTFKTSNGTAIGGDGTGPNDDFIDSGEITVTFNPGEVSKTVVVNLVGDTSAEATETFFGELSNPANAIISIPKATATITNDDAGFRISDGRLVEGGPGATTMMEFIVDREGPSTGSVSVTFATENGTAVESSDYTRTVGTLTFADGETQKTILVPILGDSTAEGESENFSVKLVTPSPGVSLIDDTGFGTIVDDEAAVVTITDKQIVEGDNGTQQMIFVVTVSGTVNGTVTLDYATIAGTATTADYTDTTGTLTFTSAGSQPIVVPIIGDLVSEGDQTFMVKLTPDNSSATVNLADDTGVGTIHDNDPTPVISVIGGKIVEGNSGKSEVKFTVKLDRPSDKQVTVDFSTMDGTANAGIDYNAIPTSKITFLPGQTEVEVFVEVLGDTELEPDQDIIGNISNATNATIGTATRATIQNDEILATIAPGSFSENVGVGTMKVSLSSGASTSRVKVSFVVTDGTAIRGTDFEVQGDIVSVTFEPGQTEKDIVFTLTDDTKFEGDETFTVKLTDAENAAIGTNSTATFTIQENEQLTISVEDQYVFEGETAVVIGTPTAPGKLATNQTPSNKTVQFTVKLSGPSEREVTVKASTLLGLNDNATAGSDFTAFDGDNAKVITFAPGETSKTVSVEIIDDGDDEPVESFQIKLTDASLGQIAADDTGTIHILDNDLRGISISDAIVSEGPAPVAGGDNGQRIMKFTLTLSAAAKQTVSVLASTFSSSAVEDVDFVGKDQVITFAPGETSKTFEVTINGDNIAEIDELFAVSLSSPNGVIITDAEAQGRIVTDEILYTFDPTSVSVVEGSSATKAIFTVKRTLTVPLEPGAVSPLATAGSVTFMTLDGTAKAGTNGDYLSNSGVLQFAANTTPGATESTAPIEVTVNSDNAFELAETFLLRLTGSTNGSLFGLYDANGPDELPGPTEQIAPQIDATATIVANGVAPTVSIEDVRKSEGNSGTVTFDFIVKLSGPNEVDAVTVNFNTIDVSAISTANPALQDFVQQSGESAKITFAKGETSKTISITVNGDTRDEGEEETFKVKLSGSGVIFTDGDDEAVGTIVDDDATPKLTFDGANNGDITVIEGNDGVTIVKLKLKLSGPSEKPIDLNVSLLPDATATVGTDFEAGTNLSQPVTFAPGATTAEVEFRILPDIVDELDEKFSVSVEATAATKDNVVIQDAGATVTITDDDAAPRLAINDVSIVEGDNGQDFLEFTVTIDGTSDRAITVDFATLDGTAVSTGITPDFSALTGKLTFAAGHTESQLIRVPINGDIFKESNETFQVKLSNATNATIARDTGTGTIQQDDDVKVALIIKDAKVTEGDLNSSGNATTKQAVFTVELSGASATATTFRAFTQNGTAVVGEDYAALDQTFTIPAGSTSVTVSVTIGGDNTFEFTESFFVSLTDVSDNVEVLDNEARGTVYGDDIQFVNPKTVRYIDDDGDLVTIKITKGILFQGKQSILGFEQSGSTGGRILKSLDFTGNPSLYSGTSLFITAEPQPGFLESGGESDGKVNVGFIQGALVDTNLLQFSRGVDFKDIVIEGDLGGMTAGDTFITPSIRGVLSVDSIGAKGTATLPGSLTENFCFFLSKVNAIKTTGDVLATVQVLGGNFGDIGKLEIGGALRGVSQQQPGKVIFTGTLANATVGQIIGGSVEGSGSISGATNTNASIGSVRVLDGIFGGSGKNSGTITSQTSINNVSIGINPTSEENGLIGGAGENSGSVSAPRIGSVTIGSNDADSQIKGGGGVASGVINGQSSLGSVKVFGDVLGGAGANSGEIFGANSIGSVRIEGSLTGGTGKTSGSIVSGDSINSVTITKNITGGNGEESGLVKAVGSLNSLAIGTKGSEQDGNLTGGSGKSSGLIDVGGTLSNATVYGSVKGGTGSATGGFQVDGAIGSLTIHRDLQGGDANAATGNTAATSAVQTGFITADRIARMTIMGDLKSGTNNGNGLADSGAIRVVKDIASLVVKGSVVGNSTARVVLAAGGTGSNHVAIGNLTIEKNAEFLDVLGGYSTGASLTKLLGNLVSTDAVIDNVTIGGKAANTGNVNAVNIVSGVAPGTDGRFGTEDDAFGAGSGVINDPKLLATISKVTIKGSVAQTEEAFGIVAQFVKKVSAGGEAVELDKLASSDKGVQIGDSTKFNVVEV